MDIPYGSPVGHTFYTRLGQTAWFIAASVVLISILYGLVSLLIWWRQYEDSVDQEEAVHWKKAIVVKDRHHAADQQRYLDGMYKDGWEFHKESGSDIIVKKKR